MVLWFVRDGAKHGGDACRERVAPRFDEPGTCASRSAPDPHVVAFAGRLAARLSRDLTPEVRSSSTRQERFPMKTIVSIPHREYPARVREVVEDKLQNLVKFYDRIVSIRAVLARESDEHKVELVAGVGHGVTLVVESRESLLEAAVDEAISRMSRVLTRHKKKLEDRYRRGGRAGH
jgi:ribosomal subunit interface protein